VFWAVWVVGAGALAQQLQVGIVTGGLTNALAAAKVTYPNPLGFLPAHGWFSVVLAGVFICSVITALVVVASVFARRRGASVDLRQQISWLGYVGLITVLWAVVLAIISAATNGNSGLAGTLSWIVMVLSALVGVPLACAAAVLKYRLYEIDRIISRTLAYTIVTGLLVGVYAALVLLATRVLSVTSPVAVAASTRGGVVHPAAVPGAEDGGSAVQPGPVRRGPDRDRVHGPAQGCRRPGRAPRGSARCGAAVPGTVHVSVWLGPHSQT
jgi:hypothetical protein